MSLKMLSSLLVLIAIPILIMSAVLLYQASKEASFIPSDGVVEFSKIEKYRYTRAGETSGSVNWRLYVDYKYDFDGQGYQGDVVSTSLPLSSTSFDKPPSKRLVSLSQEFEAGNLVTVFVNSKAPNKAVLVPLTYSKGLKWALAGLIFFAFAYYLKRN